MEDGTQNREVELRGSIHDAPVFVCDSGVAPPGVQTAEIIASGDKIEFGENTALRDDKVLVEGLEARRRSRIRLNAPGVPSSRGRRKIIGCRSCREYVVSGATARGRVRIAPAETVSLALDRGILSCNIARQRRMAKMARTETRDTL
jgi:hypothetical protein